MFLSSRELAALLNRFVKAAVVFRVQHERLHVKHRGHEAMHAEMVLILVATLIVAQIVLVQWKQRHHRSYNVSFTPRLWTRNKAACLFIFAVVSSAGDAGPDVGGASVLHR